MLGEQIEAVCRDRLEEKLLLLVAHAREEAAGSSPDTYRWDAVAPCEYAEVVGVGNDQFVAQHRSQGRTHGVYRGRNRQLGPVGVQAVWRDRPGRKPWDPPGRKSESPGQLRSELQ